MTDYYNTGNEIPLSRGESVGCNLLAITLITVVVGGLAYIAYFIYTIGRTLL